MIFNTIPATPDDGKDRGVDEPMVVDIHRMKSLSRIRAEQMMRINVAAGRIQTFNICQG